MKELSVHLSQGPAGVFSNWSPYVLLLSGAAAFFLASNAFQAGSLAASQPGLTIVDPLIASVLGVVLFGDQIDLRPLAVGGELVALIVVLTSVIMLSRSPLVKSDDAPARLSPTPSQTNARRGNRVAHFPALGLQVAEGGGGEPPYRPPASHAIQMFEGAGVIHTLHTRSRLIDPELVKTGAEAAPVPVKVSVQ